MSKLLAFSIFDSKVEAYLPPFYLQSKGEAIRAFTDASNDTQHRIGKHPSDYTLFELGEWDEKTAQFIPHATPMSLGVAIEFTKRPQLQEVA